jgi:hypothetical protein
MVIQERLHRSLKEKLSSQGARLNRQTHKGEHPDENIAAAAYSPTDDATREQNEIPLFDLFSDANMAKYLRENQP